MNGTEWAIFVSGVALGFAVAAQWFLDRQRLASAKLFEKLVDGISRKLVEPVGLTDDEIGRAFSAARVVDEQGESAAEHIRNALQLIRFANDAAERPDVGAVEARLRKALGMLEAPK